MANGQPIGNMVITLGMDGTQFGNTLDDIKRQIKLAESTMKANMAVLGDAGKSYEALSQKSKDLANVMEAERRKTDELTRRRNELIAEGKAGTVQEQKLAEQINRSVTTYARYEQQLNTTRREMVYASEGVNDLKREMDEANKANDEAVRSLKRAGDEVGAMTRQYEGLERQVEQTNRLINAQERVVSQLSAEFGENSDEANKARLSLRRLTTQHETLSQEANATRDSLEQMGRTDLDTRFNAMSEGAQNLGDKLTVAFTAPLTALGALSFSIGQEFQAVSNKVGALADGAIEKAKEVQKEIAKSMGKGYTGEEQANNQLRAQQRGFKAKDSQPVAENAEALSNVTSWEGTEIVDVMAQMREQYNYTVTQSADFIQKLYKAGVEDLDEVKEYLPQLANMGISPDRFINAMSQSMKSGAWSSDKSGDLMVEGAKRIVDSGNEDYKDIGLGKAQAKFSAGDISYVEFLNEAQKKAEKLPVSKKREFWSKVFGTQGEDIDLKSIDGLLKGLNDKKEQFIIAENERAKKIQENSSYAKLQGEMNKLKTALVPLGTALATLGTTVATAITPYVERLANWFKSLNTNQQQWVVGLGILLASLPLAISIFTRFLTPIRFIVSLFGRLRGETNNVGGAFTRLRAVITSVGGFIGNFVKGTISVAVRVFSSLGAILGRVASIFRVGLSVAIRVATTAFRVFSLALRANPIGLVITAIQLLVAGFVIAYKRSTTFRNFINMLWDKLKQFGKWLGSWAKKLYEGTKNLISKIMNKIRPILNFMWNIVKKIIGFYAKMYSSIWNIIVKLVSTVINKIRWFRDNFIRVFTTIKDAVIDRFVAIVNWVKKFPERLWNGILSKKNAMVSKMKSFGRAIGEGIEWGVNAGIRGINSLLHMIGVGSGTYSPIGKVKIKYAKGTDNHPGGLAMVNDGIGSNYKEIVRLPSGQQFIPQGRNQVLNLPKGSQVLPGDKTAQVMNSYGIPKYNIGTKAWDGIKSATNSAKDWVVDTSSKAWEGTKSVAKSVASKVTDYAELLRHPIKYTKIMVKDMLSKMSDAPLFKNFSSGFSDYLPKQAKDYILKMANLKKDEELGGGFGDFGGFSKWSGSFTSKNNKWGVYDFLYSIAQQLMSSNMGKGLVITSGARYTDTYDHSKGLAIDLSGWGRNGGYLNVAKAMSTHPYIKYAIGDNTVFGRQYGNGSKPSWAKGHMNHVHLSALSPEQAKKGNSQFGAVSDGVQSWSSKISQVARDMKVKLSKSELQGILAQIQRESGGRQNIVQSSAVNDINMRRGNPARGLLQYIPQTFKNYAVKGRGNIMSGIDQLYAFFNNSNWRRDLPYGKRGWSPTGARRFANGGLITSPTLAMAGEAGSEMVIPLTRKSRAVQLLNQAQSLLGIPGTESKASSSNDEVMLLIEAQNKQIQQQATMIELLTQLVAKDLSVNLDGRELTDSVNRYQQNQAKRLNQARGIQ